MNRLRTDFLVARSTFLTGVGSVLNLHGHLYEYNASEDPDGIAIASDWLMVGQDLSDALEAASASLPSENEQEAASKPELVACG